MDLKENCGELGSKTERFRLADGTSRNYLSFLNEDFVCTFMEKFLSKPSWT